MTKKAYMKPVMNVVKIQQRHIICASLDGNGMNTMQQSDQVDAGWSRGKGGWDVDEE